MSATPPDGDQRLLEGAAVATRRTEAISSLQRMINWGRNEIIPTLALARCREGADDFRFAVTLWISRTIRAMNSGGRNPTFTSIHPAPPSSWAFANCLSPSMSFASNSFFVEGTESLIDSPIMVKP